jgi:hypothetical protein
MTWENGFRQLKARGYRYYDASTGPIEIDWWSGPTSGKNGQWVFVAPNAISRERSRLNRGKRWKQEKVSSWAWPGSL